MLFTSIKQKIISLTAISFIGFSSISFVGSSALSANSISVDGIHKVYYPVLDLASLNQVKLDQLSERFNLAVTLGDEELLETNVETLKKMEAAFKEQASLLPHLSKEINQLATDTNQYFNQARNIAQGMIDEDISLSEAAKLAAQSNQLLNRLKTEVSDFREQRAQEFQTSVIELKNDNDNAKAIMRSFIVIALIIISVIGWLVYSRIRKDLKKITTKLNDIAQGEGDLTARLVHSKKDELKGLSDAFNLFVEKLQGNITDTIDNVAQLHEIADSLVLSSQNSSCLSVKQHKSVEQASSSLSQLSDAARNIAQNANDASDAAKSASEQASQGELQVQSTIKAVQELTDDVVTASDVVSQLDSKIGRASCRERVCMFV